MGSELFRSHANRLRSAIASELGCDAPAFDGHDLRIVPRPEHARGNFVAVLATFGTGTVASVHPAYLDCAREQVLDKHFRAMYGVFLDAIVAEGRRRGEKLASRTPNLCFTLAEVREPPPLPDGFRLTFPGSPERPLPQDCSRLRLSSGRVLRPRRLRSSLTPAVPITRVSRPLPRKSDLRSLCLPTSPRPGRGVISSGRRRCGIRPGGTAVNYDLSAHAQEVQARVARANRTATLMASLGPLPQPDRFRLFRRRSVRPLSGAVEISAYRESRPAA